MNGDEKMSGNEKMMKDERWRGGWLVGFDDSMIR